MINEKSNNKFFEKYKELFGFTKNNNIFNDNNNNKINNQNMLRYYMNILKSNNDKYIPKNFKINIISSKLKNLSQRQQQLKRNYKNIRDEIFGNLSKENSKFNFYNGSNQNIKTKINKDNILNVLYKNGILTKNNVTDNFILTSKNDFKNNNYSFLVNNSNSMRFTSSNYNQIPNKLSNNYIKRDKPIYSSKKCFKRCNNTNSCKSYTYNKIKPPDIKKNVDIFSYYNKNEKIGNKVKNFNARINILLIK